jgi:hypothetical protein
MSTPLLLEFIMRAHRFVKLLKIWIRLWSDVPVPPIPIFVPSLFEGLQRMSELPRGQVHLFMQARLPSDMKGIYRTFARLLGHVLLLLRINPNATIDDHTSTFHLYYGKVLVSQAPVLPMRIKNIWKLYLKVSKNLCNKILVVVNDVSHNLAKFQFEMLYILRYKIITKCELLWRFEIAILRSTPFAIFELLKIQIILNLNFAGLWNTPLATFRILFHNFLKLINVIFHFLECRGTRAREPKISMPYIF